MPGTSTLMGVGMPAQQAKRLGLDPPASMLRVRHRRLPGYRSIPVLCSIGRHRLDRRWAHSVFGCRSRKRYFVMNTTATCVVWPPVGGNCSSEAG